MAKYMTIESGIPKMRDTASAIYTGDYDVLATIDANTPITLPSSKTYTSSELRVYLNGQLMDVVTDYNYVGSPPRTQISFVFDLVEGDSILFRID